MLLACAQEMPESEFVVMDQSREMLARARHAWDQAGMRQSVTFELVDLRDRCATGAKFDLVITHFFLDCFSAAELHRVVANLAAAASPRSHWLLADFAVPDRGWQRRRAQVGLAMAYRFFRWSTGISATRIVNPSSRLGAAGFELCARELFDHELLYSEMWKRRL